VPIRAGSCQRPAAQLEDAIGRRRDRIVVGGHDDRGVVVVMNLAHQLNDLGPGFDVEVSGRFVAQQQRGTVQ